MAAVGITENVKGDAKKFEIWYNSREEVYIIQVGSVPTLQASWSPWLSMAREGPGVHTVWRWSCTWSWC